MIVTYIIITLAIVTYIMIASVLNIFVSVTFFCVEISGAEKGFRFL